MTRPLFQNNPEAQLTSLRRRVDRLERRPIPKLDGEVGPFVEWILPSTQTITTGSSFTKLTLTVNTMNGSSSRFSPGNWVNSTGGSGDDTDWKSPIYIPAQGFVGSVFLLVGAVTWEGKVTAATVEARVWQDSFRSVIYDPGSNLKQVNHLHDVLLDNDVTQTIAIEVRHNLGSNRIVTDARLNAIWLGGLYV